MKISLRGSAAAATILLAMPLTASACGGDAISPAESAVESAVVLSTAVATQAPEDPGDVPATPAEAAEEVVVEPQTAAEEPDTSAATESEQVTVDEPATAEDPYQAVPVNNLEACAFDEIRWHAVVNIADDDPDGGLVVHDAPSLAAPEVGVLPPDRGAGRVSDCRIGPEGIPWLRVWNGWSSAHHLTPFDSGKDPVERDDLVGLIVAEEDLPTISSLVVTENDNPEIGGNDVRVGDFVGDDAQSGTITVTYGVADDSIAGYETLFTLKILKDANADPTGDFEIVSVSQRTVCGRSSSLGPGRCS